MSRRRGTAAARRQTQLLFLALLAAIAIIGGSMAIGFWLRTPAVAQAQPATPPAASDVTAPLTPLEFDRLRQRVAALEANSADSENADRITAVEAQLRGAGARSSLLPLVFGIGLWLLLAVALAIVTVVLSRRIAAVAADQARRRTAEPLPAPPPPDPAIAALRQRIGVLEQRLRDLPTPAPAQAAPLAPLASVAAAPSIAADPASGLDETAEELRTLLNARGDLEAFNAAVERFPQALAITFGQLGGFERAAAMDQELVLFGTVDRLAVLPAPIRSRDLSRAHVDQSKLPESYRAFFELEPDTGGGFRVLAPAFARLDGDRVTDIVRGVLAVA